MRFPKVRRLLRASDFRRTQDHGVRVRTAHFVLVIAPGVAGPSRLGLIVSKKCGNAVERNRIKRLVRECFRASSAFADGVDLVVIGLPGASELDLERVSAEWSGVQAAIHKATRKALALTGARAHVTPRSDRTRP